MRLLAVRPPFDLARTVAPVWWARGRWPNVDWNNGVLTWVGWEEGTIAWRSVLQSDERTLDVSGSAAPHLDAVWASRVLGIDAEMPKYGGGVLGQLAFDHAGMKPWAAGSLFEGVVSSIVGQSISVAAAATTERRLFELFNAPIEVAGRKFWPPPTPRQLAEADVQHIRSSGVTAKRAAALAEVGNGFVTGKFRDVWEREFDTEREGDNLRAISGIGPWTVRSARLWGLGEPDAHPTGDVALLRAVHRHYPEILTLRDLDRISEQWCPFRGWAARLFWIDLLGFDG